MLLTVETVDFSNLDKKLEHLSKEQIITLINAYYDGEKIDNLLSTYKIDTTASNLVKIFPTVLSGSTCEKCQSPNVTILTSRTWARSNKPEEKCSKCGHNPVFYCVCSSCREDRAEEARIKKEKEIQLNERKKKILCDFYNEEKWTRFPESDLTLEDRLYLAVILRASLSENTHYIEPLSNVKGKMAPTPELERSIITHLTRRKILVPSLMSSVNDFEVTFSAEDERDYGIEFYIYQVHYRLNVQSIDANYGNMIKRLLYPNLVDEENFHPFCFEMWKKLSLHEYLQYLLYQMNKGGYSFQPGEKTIRVFEALLEHFSVSQIYSVIYRSVANSTQRYQSREITKIHAQNSVISGCESYGQRAIAHGWRLAHFSRLKDLPETYISKVLFTSVMQIPELGFSEKPSPHF